MKLLRLVLVFLLSSTVVSLFGQDLLTKQTPLPCLNKTFSIVVHTVQDSSGMTNVNPMEIQGLLDTLNKDFAPICVSFEICETIEIENWQYDSLKTNEWDEMQVLYHQQRRINVFFVEHYDTSISDEPCVFATQNGIAQMELGGIIIQKDCVLQNSRNLSHGMGHYFGLLHTFHTEGTGNELEDGSNCTIAGDLICDTPADNFASVTANPAEYVNVEEGCRFVNSETDANGEYYKPDVGNIMALYQYECRCSFTHGQYTQMAQNCETNMW